MNLLKAEQMGLAVATFAALGLAAFQPANAFIRQSDAAVDGIYEAERVSSESVREGETSDSVLLSKCRKRGCDSPGGDPSERRGQ